MKKLLLVAMVAMSLVGCAQKQEQNAKAKETVSFEYTIVDINHTTEEYIGESVNDDTGIFFTGDYLKDDDIHLGDKVIAVFEVDNVGEGLIEVYKK